MLICTGQPVEERRLSAVLISDKRKGKDRVIRKGISAAGWVVFSSLAKSGMLPFRNLCCFFYFSVTSLCRYYFYFSCVVQAQGQFVSMHHQFDGISHRCIFYNCDRCAGNDTHI